MTGPRQKVMDAAVEAVRIKREAREAAAAKVAAKLPAGDYYVDGRQLKRHGDAKFALACETHWDACLVMLAVGK